jgi:DNA-binding transcriptional LysR family regulator
MEPEQLRIFLAVAEHGSFTAAAKALFVSHSTTSRAVAALESELGLPLFLRQGRSVSLTQAGETLKPEAERLSEKEILRNIRRIDRNRRHTREVLTGKTAGDGSSFDLTVNASHWDIKKLAEAVAEFSGRWFEQNEE